MALRVATWNINGIKARLELVLRWLEEEKPDIVGLQEIKTVDEGFPKAEFEALGYNVETHGQKSWNGVALLSKLPFDEVHRALRVQAAKHGRSAEAEIRDILERAVKPARRVRLGDELAALGRKIGLTNEDVEVLEQMRDKTPAEPPRFE